MRRLSLLAGLCARCRRARCCYMTQRHCSQRHDANYTHFGFGYVDEQEKAKKVHGVFSSVASRYDVMNDAMSVGVHRLWKDLLVHRLRPSANCRVLDVAGGTGDVAFRILRSMRIAGRASSAVDEQQFELKSQLLDDDVIQDQCTAKAPPVVVCDINGDMLVEGRRRALLEGVGEDQMSWVEADAETLPFADCTFDAYTIAFGIRNITHINLCLSEAYRVLKPGGRFLCLEFSHVENPAFRWLYDQYSFQVIPPLGMLISGDWNSYQYLVESIRRFPAQREFARMIGDVGFRAVTYENVTGGVVAIHSGYKL